MNIGAIKSSNSSQQPNFTGAFAKFGDKWFDLKTKLITTADKIAGESSTNVDIIALSLSGPASKIEANTYVSKNLISNQKLILTGEDAKNYHAEETDPVDLKAYVNRLFSGIFRFTDNVNTNSEQKLDAWI